MRSHAVVLGERLRDEHAFTGGYTTVKDAVRELRVGTKEVFLPLTHPPGEAQVDFGFAELGLARVYAQVLAGNQPSLRVLEKLGMVCEGVKRSHVRKDRRLHDLVFYGLLREEWR